jgi:hypothetical protein
MSIERRTTFAPLHMLGIQEDSASYCEPRQIIGPNSSVFFEETDVKAFYQGEVQKFSLAAYFPKDPKEEVIKGYVPTRAVSFLSRKES